MAVVAFCVVEEEARDWAAVALRVVEEERDWAVAPSTVLVPVDQTKGWVGAVPTVGAPKVFPATAVGILSRSIMKQIKVRGVQLL